jgi:hypothetical protein
MTASPDSTTVVYRDEVEDAYSTVSVMLAVSSNPVKTSYLQSSNLNEEDLEQGIDCDQGVRRFHP